MDGCRTICMDLHFLDCIKDIIMKLRNTFSLLALATSAVFSTSALAQTANVDFQGRLLNVICTGIVAGDQGTVRLNNVLATELSNPGDTAGRTQFPVELTGCDPESANYQINFSNATVVNGRLPNLPGTGRAESVSLQLLDGTGTNILAFTPAPDTSRIPPSLDPGADIAGSGTLFYQVEYFRETPTLVPGEVRASALMTLTFL